MGRVPAQRTLENALRRVGFCYVAGVDEVGRGCLAGPVMAAAVVLDPSRHIAWVSDSKAVPAAEREELFEQIIRHANASVIEHRQDDPVQRNMYSTVVALFVDLDAQTASWGHSGDSRMYGFRDGRVLSRTKDHSLVQSLVDSGMQLASARDRLWWRS